MDIANIVSTEFVKFPADTPISKIRGAFDDPSLKGIVVTNDGTYEGVVTRRQLTASHRHPDEKVGSLIWHVPRIAPNEDVREVAQLMIAGDTRVLPVFDGQQLRGVVTADDLLREVQSFLDAVTVADAYSQDLVTVDPESTFGETLHILREHRISHLPVVEDDSVVGVLSLYDVTDIASRAIQQSQGGDASGTDPFGGSLSESGGRARRGGYGAREGELGRILDLPVRDVMTSPARTVRPHAALGEAVEKMFDIGGSSLIVVGEDGSPIGIVTKTDVLESLTWGAEGSRAVQLYGADLMDDITYDEVVSMIDKFDEVDSDMNVLDAKIHLHKHDEKLRGTPLLLARIRLHTDRGLFIANGEGYGASHAIHEARDVLERRIRDDKTYGRSKKHPDEEFWEKRFGWWLEQ